MRDHVEVLLDLLASVAAFHEEGPVAEAWGGLYRAVGSVFLGYADPEDYKARMESIVYSVREGAASQVWEAIEALAKVSQADADMAQTLVRRTALIEFLRIQKVKRGGAK